MTQKNYRVGVDLGQYSVGLTAIEVDGYGYPIRFLNSQSVIHDGGVDPNKRKGGISRKKQAGVARRVRRMRVYRRKRLARLDALLKQNGYPIVNEDDLPWAAVWFIRAQAADGYIEDDRERCRAVSISVRNIARHRGWRNPYQNPRFLLKAGRPTSDGYQQLVANVSKVMGNAAPAAGATPGQIVRDLLVSRKGLSPVNLRSHKGKAMPVPSPVLPLRLMQADTAYELRLILDNQRVPRDVADALILTVFRQKSPKGSAEHLAGKDPLDLNRVRAPKSSLAFQRYRIIDIICNLRVAEGENERLLTVEEKNQIFTMLVAGGRDHEYGTWMDVIEGLERADGKRRTRGWLKGIGRQGPDGEEPVPRRPPHVDILHRIGDLKDDGLRERLSTWWLDNDDTDRERLTRILSNSVDIEEVQEDPQYANVLGLLNDLDDSQLAALDGMNLELGRAAYSEHTLELLADWMLRHQGDVVDARQRVFHVSRDWRPPQEEIGAPIGNPAADRSVKAVARWLDGMERRYGRPQSIQIEHVRNAFTSISKYLQDQHKREFNKENEQRHEYRQKLCTQLQQEEKIIAPRDGDLRRIEALNRQDGKCLYCDTRITFRDCEMDHIVPRSGPGCTNTRDNLAAVCRQCNQEKGNLPFPAYCATLTAQRRGINLEATKRRVQEFTFRSEPLSPLERREFISAVQRRLEQTKADEPIDNRTLESTAWMAVELRKRIQWHYNQYAEGRPVRVDVFRGRLTAEARSIMRHLAGQDFHMIGGNGKTRLDRRHHAIDAAVIAMMTPAAAQVLAQRMNLRDAERLTGMPNGWQNFPANPSDKFRHWAESVCRLMHLINRALDADRIRVLRCQRYRLGNSNAHKETFRRLVRLQLGGNLPVEVILSASTPALYEALTHQPDFSEIEGLPENPDRVINVNGTILHANDTVCFFRKEEKRRKTNSNARGAEHGSDATSKDAVDGNNDIVKCVKAEQKIGGGAQILVNGAGADVGIAIHHARVYRYYVLDRRGNRSYSYGWVRVFQHDLLHAAGGDLFSEPLRPCSLSMRYADRKVRDAIFEGRAEYLGYVMVGDEIDVRFPAPGKEAKSKIEQFLRYFQTDIHRCPKAFDKWIVTGFDSETKIKIYPAYLAAEGMQKILRLNRLDSARGDQGALAILGVKSDGTISKKKGLVIAVNTLFGNNPTIVRRNVFGEPRWVSHSRMPISWNVNHFEPRERH